MGRMKEEMMDRQQERDDTALAKKLGITYDELVQLDYHIFTEESNDGLVYGYRIDVNEQAPKEILDKIIGLQDGGYIYLAPWDLGYDDYYDEEYQATTDNVLSFETFTTELDNLKKLNEVVLVDETLSGILKRQIFIGVFGTLETYLSDTYINKTLNNDTYFRNFISSYPEFRERKFELREIFNELNKLKDIGKAVMLEVIYHHLPKVREMYKSAFQINFPTLKPLMTDVLIRHDLVHRNGKTKDGKVHTINKDMVIDLITRVEVFVGEIEDELNKKEV